MSKVKLPIVYVRTHSVVYIISCFCLFGFYYDEDEPDDNSLRRVRGDPRKRTLLLYQKLTLWLMASIIILSPLMDLSIFLSDSILSSASASVWYVVSVKYAPLAREKLENWIKCYVCISWIISTWVGFILFFLRSFFLVLVLETKWIVFLSCIFCLLELIFWKMATSSHYPIFVFVCKLFSTIFKAINGRCFLTLFLFYLDERVFDRGSLEPNCY